MAQIDFLDEIIAESTERDPQFPALLAACEAHRREYAPDLSITNPEQSLLAIGESGGEKGQKKPERPGANDA